MSATEVSNGVYASKTHRKPIEKALNTSNNLTNIVKLAIPLAINPKLYTESLNYYYHDLSLICRSRFDLSLISLGYKTTKTMRQTDKTKKKHSLNQIFSKLLKPFIRNN